MTSNLYYFLIFFLDLLFVDNAADKLMPTFTFFFFFFQVVVLISDKVENIFKVFFFGRLCNLNIHERLKAAYLITVSEILHVTTSSCMLYCVI